MKKERLESLDELIKELDLSENLKNILYILAQVELFGGNDLSLEQLGKILEISKPTCIKNVKELLENEMLILTKDGKKNYYRINMSKFHNL